MNIVYPPILCDSLCVCVCLFQFLLKLLAVNEYPRITWKGEGCFYFEYCLTQVDLWICMSSIVLIVLIEARGHGPYWLMPFLWSFPEFLRKLVKMSSGSQSAVGGLSKWEQVAVFLGSSLEFLPLNSFSNRLWPGMVSQINPLLT